MKIFDWIIKKKSPKKKRDVFVKRVLRRIEKECDRETAYMDAFNQDKGLLTTGPATPPFISKAPFEDITKVGNLIDVKYLENLAGRIPSSCTIEDMDLEGHVYDSETYSSKTKAYIEEAIKKIHDRFAEGRKVDFDFD